MDLSEMLKYIKACEHFGVNSIEFDYFSISNFVSDHELIKLKSEFDAKMNLRVSFNPEKLESYKQIRPDEVCVVSIADDGFATSFDIEQNVEAFNDFIVPLSYRKIKTRVLIDSDLRQVTAAYKAGCDGIVLNTEAFAKAFSTENEEYEFIKLKEASVLAKTLDLDVKLSGKIDYMNVLKIKNLKIVSEIVLNDSIIDKFMFGGIGNAIKEMRDLL